MQDLSPSAWGGFWSKKRLPARELCLDSVAQGGDLRFGVRAALGSNPSWAVLTAWMAGSGSFIYPLSLSAFFCERGSELSFREVGTGNRLFLLSSPSPRATVS